MNLVAASVSSDLPCVDWLRGVGGNVVQWLTKDERGQKERDHARGFWKLIHWENLGEGTDFAEVQVARLLYVGDFKGDIKTCHCQKLIEPCTLTSMLHVTKVFVGSPQQAFRSRAMLCMYIWLARIS